MSDQLKIEPEKRILLQEQKEMSICITDLIARHNMLCEIEEVFRRNGTAKEYLDNAAEEILESGNQSIALKYVQAIKNMVVDIDDYECSERDNDTLISRAFDLRRENQILKAKLNRVADATKSILKAIS